MYDQEIICTNRFRLKSNLTKIKNFKCHPKNYNNDKILTEAINSGCNIILHSRMTEIQIRNIFSMRYGINNKNKRFVN